MEVSARAKLENYSAACARLGAFADRPALSLLVQLAKPHLPPGRPSPVVRPYLPPSRRPSQSRPIPPQGTLPGGAAPDAKA